MSDIKFNSSSCKPAHMHHIFCHVSLNTIDHGMDSDIDYVAILMYVFFSLIFYTYIHTYHVYIYATNSRPPSGLQLEHVFLVLHPTAHRAQQDDAEYTKHRTQDGPYAVIVRMIVAAIERRR